jgi:hypothetical protein
MLGEVIHLGRRWAWCPTYLGLILPQIVLEALRSGAIYTLMGLRPLFAPNNKNSFHESAHLQHAFAGG